MSLFQSLRTKWAVFKGWLAALSEPECECIICQEEYRDTWRTQ